MRVPRADAEELARVRKALANAEARMDRAIDDVERLTADLNALLDRLGAAERAGDSGAR